MHRIVLDIGLLVFFLSIIVFVRMQLPVTEILLRSLILFIALSILLSLSAIFIGKTLGKASVDEADETSNNNSTK